MCFVLFSSVCLFCYFSACLGTFGGFGLGLFVWSVVWLVSLFGWFVWLVVTFVCLAWFDFVIVGLVRFGRVFVFVCLLSFLRLFIFTVVCSAVSI